MKLNYRNHRKLVIIDGCIGYLGGFNVADEYVGREQEVWQLERYTSTVDRQLRT